MSALDSTHTVVVKSENRGIRVVIGLLAIILLAKWWWTGSVLHAVASAMPAEGSELEFRSVTGALLPIVIDLLWFIGSVIIFAVTNLAGILWDFGSGILETIRYYSARRAAVEAAQKAATEAGTKAAETNAGAIASTAAVDAAEKQAATSENAPPKPTPKRVDVTKLVNTLNEHDAKLAAADQAFSKLAGRIQFTEDLAGSINGWSQQANERLSKLEQRDELLAERMSQLADSTVNSRHLIEAESATRQADDQGLASEIGDLRKRLEALEAAKAPPKPALRRATRQTPTKASPRKQRA